MQRRHRFLVPALFFLALMGVACAPSSPASTPELPAAASTPELSPTAVESTPSDVESTPSDLVRVAGIIDGDTIDVLLDGERTRVRIIGIDTPERGECGYQRAASAMQSLVQSRDVRLEADATQLDSDIYDRLLRHVFTADGVNVAEELIAVGLGLEYTYDKPYAYQDAYLAAQEAAQLEGLGLWAETCPTPLALGVSRSAAPGGDQQCLIKGNINRREDRIYHVPGQRNYDNTIIDEGAGERWFCTPEEAEEAGWRAARR